MEGPRAAKTNELQQVIKLINNVFRLSEKLPPTMDKEFPLLLCEDNIDNIRVITDGNIPVSVVNYYKTDILINGSKIKAASVGAVCTDEGYRGKNLASIILDDVEEKLIKENIDVMLISGTRSLYLRRGCCIVGGFYKAVLKPGNVFDDTVQILEFEENNLIDLAKAYNREEARYYRSLYEFENFLKGATTSWDGSIFKVLLIKKYGNIIGYVVLKICNEDGTNGYIVEYAGDREALYKAFYQIIKIYCLDDITFYLSEYDRIKAYIENDQISLFKHNQCGSVKIIDFVSFMNKLKPYFLQNLSFRSEEALGFKEDERGYIFNIYDEELCIRDLDILTQLIFGIEVEKSTYDYITENLKGKPAVKKFVEAVFPLPFPWAGNMNFI